MLPDAPPKLHRLLKAAIKAGEKLQKHLAKLASTTTQQRPHLPTDDVVVLREKYHAVNRYIQSCERAARWISCQVVFAVENQVVADAADLIERTKCALERVIRPVPSWELIETEKMRPPERSGSHTPSHFTPGRCFGTKHGRRWKRSFRSSTTTWSLTPW